MNTSFLVKPEKWWSFYLYSLLIGNYAILIFQSDLGFLKTVRNGQLPTEFGECGIADKVSKVVIFENIYLWVTFQKSFIFYIFMVTY